jgi:hypothetical protein
MIKQTTVFGTIAILLLAGCGSRPTDRALSGAGIGAGAGAVGAAVISANPVTGAAVGAAAGALTGALTTPGDINLGKPVWR